MPALTINDLNNGKADLDHIAEIATSLNPTAIDRLGHEKLTIQGAVDTVKLVNPRGAWVANQDYATKDVTSVAGTWYFCIVAHRSSAAFDTDAGKWRVYQGVTAADLAAPGAAAGIGATYGAIGAVPLNLQSYIEDDGSYNVMGFVTDNLKAAIRDKTSTAEVTQDVQDALNAAVDDDRGVFFPRGRFNAPGLEVNGYAGEGLNIDGRGAVIHLGANETGLHIMNSENVILGKGLKFTSDAISGIDQIGVLLTNSGRCDIEGRYEALTYGIKVASTKTGLATGPYPIPTRLSPIVKACAAGVYCAPTGEYVHIINALIQDCTLFGVTVDAGNVKILGGNYSGNRQGIYFDGSQSSNGDHGAIIGATVNHNKQVGIRLANVLQSMLVTGNNVWAQIAEDFGAGALATSIGIYLANVKNVNLTGNVIAHNKVNLAHDGIVKTTIAHNTFKSDSERTTAHMLAVNPVTFANGNRMAPNTFEGGLVGGANDGDPEQLYAANLQSNWVDFGGTFKPVRYVRDANDIVHLSGIGKSGAMNSAAFNLPPGFRGTASALFSCLSDDALGKVEIAANGDVIPKIGSNAWFSFDGISFKAEA